MPTLPLAASSRSPAPPAVRTWDVFCRVIDNFGDIGVCWRLSADLASRGHTVRLWVDDATALTWMAPGGAPGVSVRPFEDAAAEDVSPGEVVVEAFGCDPPPAFVARMSSMAGMAGMAGLLAAAGPAPVWINLEYLSAEPWVERAHGLPSPQAGGLQKWFFFPGFAAATGGLLREPGLLEQVDAWARPEGPPRASVFCYPNQQLPSLAERFAGDFAGDLWLAPGTAPPLPPGQGLRLGWTDQPGFDRRLWSCDLNFVRGEDSLVRAIWAGRPFVWHIYPQDDGVHQQKLEAFLARLLEGAEPALAADVRALWDAWNGFGPWPARWPDAAAWGDVCRRFRDRQAALPDLVSQLDAFAWARRAGKPG
jgi:hypothetical protein